MPYADSEKRKEYSRKRKAEHKDYRKKYYIEHRERELELANKYNSEHREQCAERSRNYYKENREERRKYGSEEYQKNKEKYNERAKARYKEGKGKIDQKARTFIYKNNLRPDICSVCNEHKKIEAHHPDYNKRNEVVFCCSQCHHDIERGIIKNYIITNLLFESPKRNEKEQIQLQAKENKNV